MAKDSTAPALASHPELWATLTPLCDALDWPVDQVRLVKADDCPAAIAKKRKLLRDWGYPGTFVLSQTPQVKQWLIGAGWWHRGIADPALDIYWKLDK